MILRRITEHVNAQNWFAVGLDFVIVVIGVFIGIPVANLNDDRIDWIETGSVLVRLQQEFQLHLARTDRSLVMHQAHLAAANRCATGRCCDASRGQRKRTATTATGGHPAGA